MLDKGDAIMKKLCALLALAMMISTAGALAGTPATPIHFSGEYTYILLADGSAQIVDWDGAGTVASIPRTLDGFAVTSISENAFADCEALVSVTLPDTVTEIGEYAFSGCESLEEVALPAGLRRIGDAAFYRCNALTGIALPDAVCEVGRNPFLGCANLFDILVSPDHPYLATIDGVLFSKPDRRLICYPMGLTALRYAVPRGVRVIGETAFEQGLYLEEVVLPDTVEEIGREAFCGCEALMKLDLPNSLRLIGDAALSYTDLREVVLPAGLSEAGGYALDGGIPADGSLVQLRGAVFYGCDHLTKVTLAAGMTRIDDDMFGQCRNLERVSVPASVTGIGAGAFSGCGKLLLAVEADSYAERYALENGIACASDTAA